jgi:DNA-binding response OmpR family regulator
MRHSSLPVLMVSGHPDAALELKGLSCPTAFSQKPVAIDELVARIDSIVH